MNEKPHAHEPVLCDKKGGWNIWNIRYGDTRVRLYPWPLGLVLRQPSERAAARATRRAIAKHDIGSVREGRRHENRKHAQEVADQVRSEWYMDSQQRMDDLHAAAIREDNDRSYRAIRLADIDVSPPLDVHVQTYQAHPQRMIYQYILDKERP